MRGVCIQELDGAWGGDQSFKVLTHGNIHLVVIEVVPVSGGVDEKVNFISLKNDLRIATDCIDFDLLTGKFPGGHALRLPQISEFSFKLVAMPVLSVSLQLTLAGWRASHSSPDICC